jgi:hypothetical protein
MIITIIIFEIIYMVIAVLLGYIWWNINWFSEWLKEWQEITRKFYDDKNDDSLWKFLDNIRKTCEDIAYK